MTGSFIEYVTRETHLTVLDNQGIWNEAPALDHQEPAIRAYCRATLQGPSGLQQQLDSNDDRR
jgi:hypothetical protein